MSTTKETDISGDIHNTIQDDGPEKPTQSDILSEFCKILGEFIPDLVNTFPECKEHLHPGIIVALEHVQNMRNGTDTSTDEIIGNEDLVELLDYCKQVYPSRFFDILYKNDEIFTNDEIDTAFLPNIDFANLWSQNISDTTKDIIWKYLQIILLALLPTINDGNTFGDTAKLFEAINEDEFKKKLEETICSMQDMFSSSNINPTTDDNEDDQTDASVNQIHLDSLPNPDDLHKHINSMIGGKLGKLAQEIAEETADELDIDLENVTNVNDVFKNLFKNPGKLMSMVKGIGSKLENKIKSGEISETELMKEATTMMGEMHKMPGMNNIKSMLQQFGLPTGKNSKFNMNAFQSHMNQNIKHSQQRERMLKKLEEKRNQTGNTVFSKGEAPVKSTKADKPSNVSQQNTSETITEPLHSTKSTYKPKNSKRKRKKNKNKNC